MRIERNIPPAHAILAEFRLHLLHRRAPPARNECVRVRAPVGGIDVGAVSVPPNPGPLGDGDASAEERVRSRHAVDQLGYGRVEAEELVQDRCQDGEAVKQVGGWHCLLGCEHFCTELILDTLRL